MSKRVRALAASFLALAMLIPMFSITSAQTQPEPYPGYNKLCITGTIINFNEKLIDEPWQVTATQIEPPGAALVTTADDGKFEFQDLAPGRWQVTLTLPANWVFVEPYTESFEVTLNYGMTDCVDVRFKVKRPINVEVLKIDDNHVPLADWVIKASPAAGNWFASPITDTTDENGFANFYLTEGKWVFTEMPPAGQKYWPVMPADGKQELDVKWNDDWGDTPGKISIRFKNRLKFKGCIVVTKTDVPPDQTMPAYGLPDWKITVKRLDGSVAATGFTDALGQIKFNDLYFGPYIVEEESRIGWEPVGASSFTVNVSQPQITDPDDENYPNCEQVDFLNRQVPPGFCIEGYKIDHNGNIGIPGWVITATAVYKGDYPDPNVDIDPVTGKGIENLVATTDGTGKYKFTFPNNDYRVPGAAYKICEEQRAGWLPHTAVCQTVYLPKKPSACVKAWNFVNQQVGHWESITHGGSSSSSGSGCSYTHTVVSGESLYGIGNAYGVSASAMLAANPWVYNRPNHYVYVGDSVCIP
jgi:hypothetical protein